MPTEMTYRWSGTDALISMSRSGHRAVMEWLAKSVGKPLFNIESQLWDASIRRARDMGMRATLLVRDYPNWAASVASHYSPNLNVMPLVDNWITHASHAFEIPTILYPEWVLGGHGRKIEIGDSTRFDDARYLRRYRQIGDNAVYAKMMARTDALEANTKLFPGMTYAD